MLDTQTSFTALQVYYLHPTSLYCSTRSTRQYVITNMPHILSDGW